MVLQGGQARGEVFFVCKREVGGLRVGWRRCNMDQDKNCGVGEDCREGVHAGLVCDNGSCFSSVRRK